MSLPTQVIDRLFTRLAATYGAAWDRSLGQAPIGDVKSAWAHELQGFAGQLEALAWVLENLPERCPNVIEFRNLARKAPAPEAPRLPEPKADPARMAAEMEKWEVVRAAPRATRTDWAHRILAKHAAGVRVTRTVLAMAREVAERHPK